VADVPSDDLVVPFQGIGEASACFGGDFKRDVGELTELPVVTRAAMVVVKRSKKLC